MATWEDVRRIALGLPETDEILRWGDPAWRVRKKAFVWDRPLRQSDLAALGDAAPEGPILGAHVPDVGAKEALIEDDPEICFTTPHFDGLPAVLVRPGRIGTGELGELVTEAWFVRAPKRLAAKFPK